MGEEQGRWRLLGQRLETHNRIFAGSIFRDQDGAFGWPLYWCGVGRTPNEGWFEKGDFFEAIEPDNESDWKRGNKLT